MNKLSSVRVFSWALLALAWALQPRLSAQDLTLAPLNNTPQRVRDLSGNAFSAAYAQSYSYAGAQVVASLDAPGKPYLSGLLRASGLKPNFAYQIKLAGRASKLAGSGTGAPPDDASNAQLGLIGRWWRAYPNPGNSNDADYLANKGDPSYAYSGYLIVGFFVTDESGAAHVRFEGSNSFHVLWRTNQRQPNPNDGPEFDVTLPATTGNAAYDPASPAPATMIGLYGEWEPTRALPNTLSMPAGHYACDFVLTEESFHDNSTGGGNWTSVMAAPLEFDSVGGVQQVWAAPAALVYPTALGAAQFNATASAPGTFSYSPPAGTVLAAGTHTLTAQFAPADAGLTVPLPITVTISVKQGLPVVSWAPPTVVRANEDLKAELFNYSASVPGTFVSGLPPSGVLASGAHTFTLQFVPTDLTDYQTPAPLVATITAVAGLLITSGPEAAPNPGYAGWPVRFSAQAVARGLTWSWDFGDGSAPASGAAAGHIFAAPGDYTVALTVQVPGGRAEHAGLVVKVLPANGAGLPAGDADGDGFSNALEMALGSDPLSAESTPLNAGTASNAGALSIASCEVRTSTAFATPFQTAPRVAGGSTRLRFKAALSMGTAQPLAGKTLALDVGGNVLVLTLDAHGRARGNGVRASVKMNAEGIAVVEVSAAGFDAPLSGVLAGGSAGQSAAVVMLLGSQAASARVNFNVTQSRDSLLYVKQ